MLVNNKATQAGEAGGGESLIYKNITSSISRENLRDYLWANTLVGWSKLTLKIRMQQENMQEVNARGEQDGGFQQETIHLKENKT